MGASKSKVSPIYLRVIDGNKSDYISSVIQHLTKHPRKWFIEETKADIQKLNWRKREEYESV